MKDWIEIFKGGKQQDSAGIEHDGDALIDTALSKFNAEEHEPPVVIGHPADNAPAQAWVGGLKKATRDGVNYLMAKFKQVAPAFESMVKTGMFKKRSAAFYPDGGLRHVGFLGAMPPAVKGLKDIGFAAGEATFEFTEEIPQPTNNAPRKETKAMTFSEFAEMFKFWKETGQDAPAALLVQPQIQPVKPAEPTAPTFSEADVEKAKKEAAESERQKLTIEFAEKEKAMKRKARTDELIAWVDAKVAKGEIIPAWTKMGLKKFMVSLIPVEMEFQFAEGGTKQTPFDWFKAFVNVIPDAVPLGEFADAHKSPPTGSGKAAIDFEAAIKVKMAKDPAKTWIAAFNEVQVERPDIVREYQQSIGN
jgi:hypothetical protein